MSTTTRQAREKKSADKKLSLASRLRDARNRLFKAAIGIVLGVIAGWFLADFVWNALRDPVTVMAHAEGRNAAINFPSITGAFDLKIQISLYIGFVLSSPVWLYQLFAIFVPELSKKGKRYTLGFFFSAVPLFLAGCAAGWFVVPHIVALLTGFAPVQDSTLIDAKLYFDFVLKLVVAVGIAFVLPVFLVLLNYTGILSGAAILKSWRIALLIICLFTAIATPAADVLSMLLLAVPMAVLYILAAYISLFHDKRVAKRNAKLEAELAASI